MATTSFTATTAPQTVGAGTAPQIFRNRSTTTQVVLRYGPGLAEVLYPGAGANLESRTWVQLPAVGTVTAYTKSGTATLDVVDVAADSGGVVKAPASSTVTRPAAAAAGVGAHMFDTTLGKPIWSDGSVWKDATGLTV